MPSSLNEDQLQSLEKLLFSSLSRVVDFIKFAEAKNAALLTFASAWILAICSLLGDGKTPPPGFHTAFIMCLPLFVMSALIAMSSFWPRLSLSKFLKTDERESNLLYFGDVALLRIPDFKSQVQSRYISTDGLGFAESMIDDLAGQVVVTSRIAKGKFRCFNVGSVFSVAAIIVLAMPALKLAWETVRPYVY
jgi:hypothetical protein